MKRTARIALWPLRVLLRLPWLASRCVKPVGAALCITLIAGTMELVVRQSMGEHYVTSPLITASLYICIALLACVPVVAVIGVVQVFRLVLAPGSKTPSNMS